MEQAVCPVCGIDGFAYNGRSVVSGYGNVQVAYACLNQHRLLARILTDEMGRMAIVLTAEDRVSGGGLNSLTQAELAYTAATRLIAERKT